MRILFAAASLLLVTSCVGAPEGPPPPPRTQYVPPPAAPPPPVPAASSDWRDWPLTPGTWRYARSGGGSVARFGDRLALSCDSAARRVTLAIERPGSAASAVTVRTSSTARVVPTNADAGGRAVATLAGSDTLLDAMGFSRGRFVIEQAGAPALVVPAWAEILRVTEDCRG